MRENKIDIGNHFGLFGYNSKIFFCETVIKNPVLSSIKTLGWHTEHLEWCIVSCILLYVMCSYMSYRSSKKLRNSESHPNLLYTLLETNE